MSLEETARRIKHLKLELRNAKKAKKVLKRTSSRTSSRGSSDSLSSPYVPFLLVLSNNSYNNPYGGK
jgi:hypothetical protein